MLSKLTAKPAQCKQLIDLGIESKALIYHMPMGDDGEYITLFSDEPGDDAVPAWTKEELDVMIGNDFPKPDLIERRLIGKATDPHTYPVHLTGGMKSFKSGAEASAFVLIYLIENEYVKPIEASIRHQKTFKL